MKQLPTIILIATYLTSFGQTSNQVEKELQWVQSIQHAEQLMKKFPKWNIELMQVPLGDAGLNKKIARLRQGNSIWIKDETGGYTYKLLHIEFKKENRASYIYLDGKRLSLNEIDSLRTLIIKKYNSGIAFSDLFHEYNMDSNPNEGDLGWFEKGKMVSEFENAVESHKKDELFTVDVVQNGWYYVVLKTHDQRQKRKSTVIRVKTDRSK